MVTLPRFVVPCLGLIALTTAALTTAALSATAPALTTAPTTATATLTEALEQLQSGHTAAAAKSLAEITASEPRNARAWRALGLARLNLNRIDSAILAFEKALALDPDSPRTLYDIGAAYAAKHDAEHAIDWLRRTRAGGRYDMTEITVDPHMAGLRGDPRVAALLPTARDFENPFVEPVKIIREWRGEAGGDQFGWIARNIGDVDGDGVTDIVTSAPTHGAGAAKAGRIYVYSAGTGKLLWTADGRAGDELGTGVEGVGDTNGDGIPDVAASGPSASGVAYIYSGRDGRVLQAFQSRRADELFGSHISGAGDVNRDGAADVIIGAPGKDGENSNAGHAYVFSGKDGKLLLTLTGERLGDAFGSTVAGYSDGKQHYLVVGAPHAGPNRHGRVYVYEDSFAKPTFTIDADATGNALGAMFVSVLGDVDGDGISDIFASDWSNEAKGHSTGRIYVHSGRTGQRLFSLTGETAGDGFGTSSSAAGDVDGDGRTDLIVGAWQYGMAATSAGRAYLYSGRDGSLMKTFTCRIPGDTFGFDAVGIGDVDGDGTVDLLISSAWSGVNGHHSGRLFVISSGVTRKKVRAPTKAAR